MIGGSYQFECCQIAEHVVIGDTRRNHLVDGDVEFVVHHDPAHDYRGSYDSLIRLLVHDRASWSTGSKCISSRTTEDDVINARAHVCHQRPDE